MHMLPSMKWKLICKVIEFRTKNMAGSHWNTVWGLRCDRKYAPAVGNSGVICTYYIT